MRKVVSLGLCALIFLTFTGIVVAGSVDDCDILKKKNVVPPAEYVPGLYGLCVAWYNASENGDENAILRIEARYAAKSGGDSIPGSGGSNPDVDPPFECLCWAELTESTLCDLGTPVVNTLVSVGEPGSEFEDVYEGVVIFINSDGLPDTFGVPADLSECAHHINNEGIFESNLSTTQGVDCGFEIGVISTFNSSGSCPVGG